MVLLEPVPLIEPGVIIQLPDGNPFNTTLPVATKQVGCVITPTKGAVGGLGCSFTVTAVGEEVQVVSDTLRTVTFFTPIETLVKVELD